jgi:hypothetical protein
MVTSLGMIRSAESVEWFVEGYGSLPTLHHWSVIGRTPRGDEDRHAGR